MPHNKDTDLHRAHVRARMSRDCAELAATITDELAVYGAHFRPGEKRRLKWLRQNLTITALALEKD